MRTQKPVFEKTNLQYDTEYDYRRSRCTCDAYERGDYCRCTTIEEAWVESVDVRRVAARLYQRHRIEDSEINQYCFDRICSAFRIFDKSLYEVESCSGYYGEEIDGVYFTKEEELYNTYREMFFKQSDVEKIKFCLQLEYGYLLDRINQTSSVTIIEVKSEDVVIPQTEYFYRLNRQVIEDYKGIKLPIALCVRDGNKYKIIDGYHRFAANKDRPTMKVIVLE